MHRPAVNTIVLAPQKAAAATSWRQRQSAGRRQSGGSGDEDGLPSHTRGSRTGSTLLREHRGAGQVAALREVLGQGQARRLGQGLPAGWAWNADDKVSRVSSTFPRWPRRWAHHQQRYRRGRPPPARSHGRPEQEKGAINTAEKAGRMLRQDTNDAS